MAAAANRIGEIAILLMPLAVSVACTRPAATGERHEYRYMMGTSVQVRAFGDEATTRAPSTKHSRRLPKSIA